MSSTIAGLSRSTVVPFTSVSVRSAAGSWVPDSVQSFVSEIATPAPSGACAAGRPPISDSTTSICSIFDAPDGGFHCLAFAKDGKTLVTGSSDTTVMVWDVVNPPKGPKVKEPKVILIGD